jgi:hypothetical protein
MVLEENQVVEWDTRLGASQTDANGCIMVSICGSAVYKVAVRTRPAAASSTSDLLFQQLRNMTKSAGARSKCHPLPITDDTPMGICGFELSGLTPAQ